MHTITIERFVDKYDALDRERQLIQEHQPTFNLTHNSSMHSVRYYAMEKRCNVTKEFRKFLESASVPEVLEMLNLSTVFPHEALAVLKGEILNPARSLARIKSILKYMKRRGHAKQM